MKPIELTQDHKDTLLEMFNKLFSAEIMSCDEAEELYSKKHMEILWYKLYLGEFEDFSEAIKHIDKIYSITTNHKKYTEEDLILAMKMSYLEGCDVTGGIKKGTSKEFIKNYLSFLTPEILSIEVEMECINHSEAGMSCFGGFDVPSTYKIKVDSNNRFTPVKINYKA